MWKALLGLLFWLLVFGGLGTWLSGGAHSDRQRLTQLIRFASESRRQVELNLSELDLLQVGDPIFLEGAIGSPPIGRIARVESRDSDYRYLVYTDFAVAEFFGSSPQLSAGDWLSLHQSPQSMGWVIETMLPPSMREEIGKLIGEALVEHQAELTRRLQPLVMQSLRRSGEVIRDDFQRAVLARADRIKAITQRYQAEFVDGELGPLLRDEVWPIIQREARPIADEMGQQLWRQASLWGLTWRWMYDASPLPQRDLTKKEFERFVQFNVVPTFQQYRPQLIEVQKRIFNEIVQNEQVRAVAKQGLEKLSSDAELHALLIEIFNDVVVRNPRLTQVWGEIWTTPEAQAVMQEVNERLEPTITAIGEAMFGNPKTRITPEFSKVLRNKVLIKDQRWLVLHRANPNETQRDPLQSDVALVVVPGDPNAENPFHIPARPRK